jgi:Tfp pilus assembly protein FimT
MKFSQSTRSAGFTLGEMMVCVGIASVLFAAIFSATVALNRAYAAADDYFSSHIQQIRIMDYLARDVKRSFSVTTSPDLKTVTCIMPDYVIQPGDPEAVTDATAIGTRRTPVVVLGSFNLNKATVDYGTRMTRTVTDGVTLNGSATLTSSKEAAFTPADVGNPITGTNIPASTTISGYTNATTVTLSQVATASGSPITFKIYGDGNRSLTDAVTNNGSTTLTSATAYFTAADVGKPVVGTTLVAGTQIVSVQSATSATLSTAAVNPSDVNGVIINPFTSTVTVGGTVVVYTVTGNTITRSENGVVTTIASSTDQLLPQTTDWRLSNTEYTNTTVIFQPIFTQNGSALQKSGTTVYATAYLRNKRRGN